MGFLDKIKDMVSITEDDFDDEVEMSSASKNNYDDEPVVERPARRSFSKSQPASDINSRSASQMQVVLVKPVRIEAAPPIADHLNFKRTVVLNLEAANKEISRRLLDFLSGAAYIKNGEIKKVANSTYIITPCNVDVTGELLSDEIDTSGLYF